MSGFLLRANLRRCVVSQIRMASDQVNRALLRTESVLSVSISSLKPMLFTDEALRS